jgi:hypothetical protein
LLRSPTFALVTELDGIKPSGGRRSPLPPRVLKEQAFA